jgi:flagellar biosynthetic protein FliR
VPSQLEAMITAAACIAARVSGLLVFAPFLSGAAIAPRIKAGLLVLLTALLYPVAGVRGISLGAAAMLRVMLAEALVGLLIGLAVQFVFEAAQFAGQVMGTQVGFGLVNIIDPNTQVDTPVLAVFSQTMAMLIFLHLGVHRWLIRALANSFVYLPPGAAVPGEGMLRQLLHGAGGIWLTGVQIAAPVLLATLLTDLVLGFLGKASPQLPVLFLGLSVKSMVGLLILGVSLKYWPSIIASCFTRAVGCGERLLQMSR